MTRRRFAFWLGFGLFSLGERLRAEGLDKLAAEAMRVAGAAPPKAGAIEQPKPAVHWTADEDDTWRWYERESWIDGEWTQTGMTTPIHKQTGERKAANRGYLDVSLLPAEMRADTRPADAKVLTEATAKPPQQLPTATRRSRHGRPPSKWLRRLKADELSIWLTTIETHEADVSGMTFFEHLTRDHSFDPEKIEGLTDEELGKLHGAAHFGY
ncbi:MAG: hypothetical protein WD851_09435 [Pirellulales bacterium]